MAMKFNLVFEPKEDLKINKKKESLSYKGNDLNDKVNLSTNEENYDPNNLKEDNNIISDKRSSNKNSQYRTKSMGMCSTVRSYGMSEFHSSNSLQNSVPSWTFGKSHRFSSLYKRPISEAIYNLPNFKETRTTSFGIGERNSFSINFSLPPNLYNIDTCFDINKKKKKGVIISERLNQTSNICKNPGPGTYNVINKIGNNKNAVQVRSRIMYFYGKFGVILDIDLSYKKHCISPQKYLPSTKIQQNHRYTNIGFGKGNRVASDNTSVKQFPGPGTYDLPSIFQKRISKKVPLN